MVSLPLLGRGGFWLWQQTFILAKPDYFRVHALKRQS